MPCTSWSSFKLETTSSSSFSEQFSGNCETTVSIPTFSQAFDLRWMKVWESLLSPTKTTANLGNLPMSLFILLISSATFNFMWLAIGLPSRIAALWSSLLVPKNYIIKKKVKVIYIFSAYKIHDLLSLILHNFYSILIHILLL